MQLAGNNTLSGTNSFAKPIVSTVAAGTAPFSVSSNTVVPNLDASYLGGAPASSFALLNGANNFGATQTLENAGIATTSTGYGSADLQFQASVYNSSESKPVQHDFVWKAEAVSNDQAAASATLNLLHEESDNSNGLKETGLSITSSGLVTFASGQTFPGSGTITGQSIPAARPLPQTT